MELNNHPWLVPDRMRTTLKYTSVVDLSASSAKDANFILRPTSIFDVDPLIGGSSTYGYAEWAPFYNRYRVHSSRLTVRFSNREVESCDVYILPTNTNPGANVADPSPYYTHPAAKKGLLGSVYAKDNVTLSYKTTTLKMGAVADFADDAFSSPFGSNPTQDWFWFIGAYKGASLNLTNGVTCYVECSMAVDLYDKRVLETGLLLPRPVRVKHDGEVVKSPPANKPSSQALAAPQVRPGFTLPNQMAIRCSTCPAGPTGQCTSCPSLEY